MFFTKKKTITAVANGEFHPLETVNDPVFAQKMMGDGVALLPKDKQIYSPVSGRITMISEQKHGIGIQLKDGTDVLIHMGIDTVELNGAPFDLTINVDEWVEQGEFLGTMDIEAIKEAGKETMIMIVCPEKELKKIVYSQKQAVEKQSELAVI